MGTFLLKVSSWPLGFFLLCAFPVSPSLLTLISGITVHLDLSSRLTHATLQGHRKSVASLPQPLIGMEVRLDGVKNWH